MPNVRCPSISWTPPDPERIPKTATMRRGSRAPRCSQLETPHDQLGRRVVGLQSETPEVPDTLEHTAGLLVVEHVELDEEGVSVHAPLRVQFVDPQGVLDPGEQDNPL